MPAVPEKLRRAERAVAISISRAAPAPFGIERLKRLFSGQNRALGNGKCGGPGVQADVQGSA